MATQQYVLEAWLGDDHGLDEDQLAELLNISDEIAERYPDEDAQPERDAALSAAYRLMVEPVEDVLADYGKQRVEARAAASAASAALQQAARLLIPKGKLSEAGFSEAAQIDRMAVRRWFGKR
jgi:hypothetical protein